MFAGKTEELLRRLRKSEYAGRDTRLFKPARDDRYEDEHGGKVATHNGRAREAVIIEEGEEEQIYEMGKDLAVVGIDEANFFTENVIDVVTRLADNGCRVIVCGIGQTFNTEPFTPVAELMVSADDLTQLHAVCTQCGKQATRNQRLIDGEPAPASSPTIKVGGEDVYEARCRHCHIVPDE
jgi:Thymidine kinase